jgi:predicted RNA binding protein YcfA (HicA-like mRNA interferase family)
MTAREILKILHKDGWYDANQDGSHLQLKHPTKPGKVTVPKHSGDIAPGTLNRIYRQAGLK